MSEDTVNPYESVASDAASQLVRVKALSALFEERIAKASESEKAAIVAEGLSLLWKEFSGTALSLIADVSALTRDLDEGLSGVEEAIDGIADADAAASVDDSDDEDEDEEGDSVIEDNEDDDDDSDENEETGDSQLEVNHAETLKFLLATLKTMLETAIAQPALDPQQKSELQTIVTLCANNIKFIDDVTLVDDEEEGEEDEDGE